MTSHAFHSLRSLLSPLAGGLMGLGLGCVVISGGSQSKDCGDPGTHSSVQNDTCVCDPGYEFCNDDPDDFTCCEIGDGCGPNGFLQDNQCWCDPGFTWCNPADPADLSCCPVGGTAGTAGTGTGGGTATGGTGGGVECSAGAKPSPDDCTTETEGAFFCSHNDPAQVGCSQLWKCMGGQWVDAMADADASCQFDGWEWAYGCFDDAASMSVVVVCGAGPGTACDDTEPSFCLDADRIHYCRYGRLTEASCLATCQEVGDEELVTYDYGECREEGGAAACMCCDEGTPGCPAGGGTGGTTGGVF